MKQKITVRLMDKIKDLCLIEVIEDISPDVKSHKIGVYYRASGVFKSYLMTLVGSDGVDRADQKKKRIKLFAHAGEFLNELEKKGVKLVEHDFLSDLADECHYIGWLIDSKNRKKINPKKPAE